jgi:hypothetical protein
MITVSSLVSTTDKLEFPFLKDPYCKISINRRYNYQKKNSIVLVESFPWYYDKLNDMSTNRVSDYGKLFFRLLLALIIIAKSII